MRLSRMISAVDLHACGEPGRVITGGVLDVPGDTMFEKKTYLEQHADGLRKLMLREPRGYPAANCNLCCRRPIPMRRLVSSSWNRWNIHLVGNQLNLCCDCPDRNRHGDSEASPPPQSC